MRNKYHNKPAYIRAGQVIVYDKNHPPPPGTDIYDSMAEASYAVELDLRVGAGDITSWTRQVPLRLMVNNKLIKKMVVDFVLRMPDGSLAYREYKSPSSMTPVWRQSVRLLAALEPTIDYDTVGEKMPLPLKKLFKRSNGATVPGRVDAGASRRRKP